MTDVAERVEGLDGPVIDRALDELGYATTPPLLTPWEWAELVGLDGDDRRFRSRIDMARCRFGIGDQMSRREVD